MSFSVYFVDLLMCCLLIICIEKHYKHYKSDTFFCFIIFLYLYQLVAEFIRSILLCVIKVYTRQVIGIADCTGYP